MLDALSRWLLEGARRPVMLMYHAVAPGGATPAWPWAVSLEGFCRQLDLLAGHGYRTVTVGDLVRAPGPGDRTVAITFDDGYVDNLAAWEALRQRGMCATWFVVTGSIGRDPSWAEDGRPAGRLLNAGELVAMSDTGMEIASHTVSHARLPGAGPDAARQELSDSKACLEDLLGRAVGSFAYPYGEWDAASEAAVAEAGFRAACTTRTGWALLDDHPLRLRRLTVFNRDSVSMLARKLAFASNEVGWGRVAGYCGRRLAARVRGG